MLDKIDQLVQDTSSRLQQLAELDTVREKQIAQDTVGIDYENSTIKK